MGGAGGIRAFADRPTAPASVALRHRGSCRTGRDLRCRTASTGRSWWCGESSESSDPVTVPTLHTALDSNIGGTVEMADEGPFFNDDFRVAGETRLIRARPGYRPIVRVERSSLEAVRKQPAVFVLDRKNLILDGIDLVVDVRDVSPEQTAFSPARDRISR